MKKAFFLLLLVIACMPLVGRGQVDIIKTIVGVDTQGYCCDGEAAVNAKLYYPESIWLDKYNNIYIADAGNDRIRKIDNSTGIITTIAGTGTGGYSGDNGPATNAELFLPEAVIVDSTGNIYIADAENNVIRKIDGTTNIITTIAGNGLAGSSGDNGPATSAELNKPSGLCFDKSGNIVIADDDNSKIRKINIATGTIMTIAGTGVVGYAGDHGLAINAELSQPLQVAVDSSGNVLFSDTYNSVVRRIDVLTGIITTIAGTGYVGYFGDDGPAINAEFYLPFGLYVDEQQNIFIADDENGAVRKINALTGIITTVAGTGVPGYSGDGGPATNAQVIPTDIFFDNYGAMFIADAGNNCIRKVYNPTGIKRVSNTDDYKLFPNYR